MRTHVWSLGGERTWSDPNIPTSPCLLSYSTDPNLMMPPMISLPAPGEESSTLSVGAVGKSWLCDLSQPLSITWLGRLDGLKSPEAGEIQAETVQEKQSSCTSRDISESLSYKAGNCVFLV